MNEENRIPAAARPAAIDDLLATTLHLGVAALHGSEIEVLGRSPRRHGGGCSAAETDEHGRAAEYDQRRAGGKGLLLDVFLADIADTACQHDRLVIAAKLRSIRVLDALFVGSEITAEIGTAELVVEGGRADRALEHDIERGDNASRPAMVGFPGFRRLRQLQVRDRETGQASLGLAADACRALIADLAAGTGRRAGIGRDCCRVIVCLHFHENVDILVVVAIGMAVRIGKEAAPAMSRDDRGVVLVGREHVDRRDLRGVAYHVEQRVLLLLAVDDPVGIENLVAAMLGVGLGEHHEFDVGRVAIERFETLDEVINLVIGKSKSPVDVGLRKGLPATGEQVDAAKLSGLCMQEELPENVVLVPEDLLCHAVMQRRQRCLELFLREPLAIVRQVVCDTTLDALHDPEPAVVRDIGRLCRPGRDGAGARCDNQQPLLRNPLYFHRRTIGQQGTKQLKLLPGRLAGILHEVDKMRSDSDLMANIPLQCLGETL